MELAREHGWHRLAVTLICAAFAIAGCNTFAPWDEPERQHCVCERAPEPPPHWLVMYTCGNEGPEKSEEIALEWCEDNFGGCIDCTCESAGTDCDL